MRKTLSTLWELRGFLLSHHPACERFSRHVFVVRGRRVCLGCASAYPGALSAFLVFSCIGSPSIAVLIFIALTAVYINILQYAIPCLDRYRAVTAAVRFSFGFGVVSGFNGVFLAPWPLMAVLFAEYVSFLAVVYVLKMWMDIHICRKCPSGGENPLGCPYIREALKPLLK